MKIKSISENYFVSLTHLYKKSTTKQKAYSILTHASILTVFIPVSFAALYLFTHLENFRKNKTEKKLSELSINHLNKPLTLSTENNTNNNQTEDTASSHDDKKEPPVDSTTSHLESPEEEKKREKINLIFMDKFGMTAGAVHPSVHLINFLQNELNNKNEFEIQVHNGIKDDADKIKQLFDQPNIYYLFESNIRLSEVPNLLPFGNRTICLVNHSAAAPACDVMKEIQKANPELMFHIVHTNANLLKNKPHTKIKMVPEGVEQFKKIATEITASPITQAREIHTYQENN